MDQLGTVIGTAEQVVHAAHASATGLGLEPVPTMIVAGLLALFALVGLVAGGSGRRPRGAHRA